MSFSDIKKPEENDLAERYGPLIGGNDLVKVLGFRTNASFRQAVKLKRLEVKTFEIEGRRGRFALTVDVEKWLNKFRERKMPKTKFK